MIMSSHKQNFVDISAPHEHSIIRLPYERDRVNVRIAVTVKEPVYHRLYEWGINAIKGVYNLLSRKHADNSVGGLEETIRRDSE